jgi:uncharacterized protein YukE
LSAGNPGAGEPAGIRTLAATRSAKAESLRAVYSDVTSAAETVTDSEWRGRSQAAFMSAVESVTPDLLLLAKGLDAQAQALESYAGQVQQIKDRQAALELQRSRALSALETIERALDASHFRDDRVLLEEAVSGKSERSTAILRQRAHLKESISAEKSTLRQIDAQWEELVACRRQVDGRCAEALSGREVLGGTWQFKDGTIRTTPPADLLAKLVGLSASDLRVLLTVRPELADQFARMDPDVIAVWWKGMDGPFPGVASAAQAALIAGIPSIIGNLNGVGFWARDRANNLFLEQATADARRDPAANADRLKAFEAVKTALGRGLLESPPRQLVSFSLDPDPKAAISNGDLDKATNVTYLVPGMGTNVAGNMTSYERAATALFRYQDGLASADSAALAVVAWLDYTPPGPNDMWGVANDYLAEAGAEHLAGALNGLQAVHSAAGSTVDVSVVGHSY